MFATSINLPYVPYSGPVGATRGHLHDGEDVAEYTEIDFNLVAAFAFS